MKRFFASIVLVAAVAAAFAAFAGEAAHKGTVKTLTGELVDTGCYLGHAARGEKHVSCASKCIANGMPMALLTDNGELYLITQNHDNLDAYNQCKDMVSQIVEVTGPVMSRRGMKAIQADAVKAAPAAAAAPAKK